MLVATTLLHINAYHAARITGYYKLYINQKFPRFRPGSNNVFNRLNFLLLSKALSCIYTKCIQCFTSQFYPYFCIILCQPFLKFNFRDGIVFVNHLKNVYQIWRLNSKMTMSIINNLSSGRLIFILSRLGGAYKY